MATKDADGGNAAATRPAEKPTPQTTQIDKRLEPLEEFRSRAEGWMKEVTAQVARLASSFEHEDKKRQALEDRLSDIEERIRSLLTLTELVSLDKNPFAGSPNATAQAAPPEPTQKPSPTPTPTPSPSPSQSPTPTPEASPEVQTPPAGPLQDPDVEAPAEKEPRPTTADGEDDDEEGEKDLEPPVPAADRPGVEVIPVGPPKPAAAPEQDPFAPEHETPPVAHEEEEGPEEALETGSIEEEEEGPEALADPPTMAVEDQADPKERQTDRQAEGQEDAAWEDDREDPVPEESEPSSSPSSLTPEEDNPARPVHAHHPNDAEAESSAPAPRPSAPPAAQGPTARAKTARRLLVVAWADLLAPAAQKIDVERFTGFYEEAGWVDEETAWLVCRLVEEITPHTKPVKKCDMRALNEATVRLLAEHDPELTTFERVDDMDDDAPTEESDGETTSLNAT